MPVAIKMTTKLYTIPVSGVASLAVALGLTRTYTWIKAVTMRAARTNAADVFWSDSGLDKGGFIGPGEAINVDFGDGQSFAEEFFIQGTSGDKVYLSVDVNRYYSEHPGS